jgi:ribulose-5-phosphate 4-epimerase/fuculose-1-phosphate aldolase
MSPTSRIASANHILYDQGILDGFGHVSQRDPVDPAQFLLSRNMAPALVRPQDLLAFDLQGEAVVPGGPRAFVERYIHAAIYRVRPDVNAVVHSHTPAILPFGILPNLALCPICHMSGFIRRGTPIHDIRDDLGPGSDMLIRSLELGASLAGALGDHALVLMRGHGMTVVGNSLEQAVYRAIYTEVNARIQLTAGQLGTPNFLTVAEAETSDAANQVQLGRAWEFWALRAQVAVGPLHAAMLA